MCGQRVVSTLDHVLPKSRFPALTVTPLNLVPVCKDCNFGKLADIAEGEDSEVLHPYFGTIDEVSWLKASVVRADPLALSYFVKPDADWDAALTARVERHFRHLGLGRLYGVHAASELQNIRLSLVNQYGDGGADGASRVRENLQREAESRLAVRRNSWEGALYEALSSDAWFCSGGFVGILEA